mmetsp:Transcript_17136/g.47136  ORF Transcript_17136/g.47136 Transcript_17136/m.47136 type:complete len:92 (-) Transcript_17136:255-530(-)
MVCHKTNLPARPSTRRPSNFPDQRIDDPKGIRAYRLELEQRIIPKFKRWRKLKRKYPKRAFSLLSVVCLPHARGTSDVPKTILFFFCCWEG